MESLEKEQKVPSWFGSYEVIRADVYVVLASLLAAPPSDNNLHVLTNMEWDEDIPERMHEALLALRRAGREYQPAAVREEYNRLFIGLGCGEVIPYASWYRERAIQSLPLAALRSDLFRLGLVRQAANHDSEDSAGALCEIMALISQRPDNESYETQAAFFDRHIAPWMMAFFKDVESAKSVGFFKAVAVLGCSLIESEKEYFKNGVTAQVHREKRRSTR
ncbi:MAG TPA: molecular chaperone TorD family protein [Syntrophales bacterium]|nr:molecular chaperone TorD family protein [Syntrophales bacterium]